MSEIPPAAASVSANTGPPPACIGKYEIVALLGKGAMGAVYRAHDPVLDRDVALKVMLPQIADDPEQKQRFEREARAVARMMHPNVVTVFDLGYHTDGSPYIVMEMLRGRDLLQAMQTGSLTVKARIEIVVQALAGLGHAHRVGIVHRDVKPANLFLTDEGVTKIMDFGVARLTSCSVTAAGVVFGTANYMSPEQVFGGPLDGRSDLFSVGSMLCELVSGRRPFQADSVMTTLYKIAHDEPTIELPSGPEFLSLLPVLKRSLAKKVEDRFASAAEMAEALEAFLHGPSASATTPAKVAVAVEATRDMAALSAPVPTIATPRPAMPDPAPLLRLLREIYVGARTGNLHFTHGAKVRSFRIAKGRIVHASCDVPGEHLGEVAVRYGLLSQADLERAVAIVLRDRKRLGTVLSELEILDRARFEEAVGLHVREMLFNVLDEPGSHVFEEAAEGDLDEDLGSRLSTGELILEATRRVQDPVVVRRALGDMDRILELSTDPLLRAQRIDLTPTDGFILSRIDGATSARDLVGLIPLPPEDTERSLLGLLCTGTVGYRPEPTRARPAPEASRVAARPAAPAPPFSETAAPRAPAPPRGPAEAPARGNGATPGPDTAAIRKIVLETFAGLRQKDHFEVLGLGASAPDTAVREAYTRLARLLHPDSNREVALADVKEQRAAVFVRVCEAYETLREPDSRATYERQLEGRKPRREASVPPSVSSPAPSTPVRATPIAPEVLAAVASAPATRPDPEEELLDGGEAIRRAERYMKAERYFDAIQQLEKVIPRLHGPFLYRAQVALATAYAKNPKWAKRADDLLQSLIRENPKGVEAYVVLGNLYRDGKLLARATGMYRKALELDPAHAEARLQLDALDAPPKRVGALRGLFG